jgi:hypothetical protein
MASVSISGDVSGAISIAAPLVAGSGTLTLPTGTDTLVGKATTDTLTNKTLTSPVLTTPALGTPASGVLTNCTGVAAAALPAGSVLQVVSASFAQSFTTSSTSFVATHLTASITPRSASNKILIFSFARVDTQAANRDIRLTIYRNATNLGVGSVNMLTNINGISSRLQLSQVLHIQDSPATTSSTAYTVYVNSPGAALVQLGDTDTDQVITLMEIAG